MEATTAAASELLASEVAPETMRIESVEPGLVEEFDMANEEDDELVFNNSPNAAGVHQSTKQNLFSSVTLLFDSSFNSPLGDLGGSNLTSELCIPYDDLAELEWVSSFAEDSYSSEVTEKIQFISGMSARPSDSFSTITEDSRPDPSLLQVPGKARSKRPRTAPGNWSSRLLLVSPPGSDDPVKKKKTVRRFGSDYPPTDGRKCLHCQTDKTPQWRTGPMGPKTLCNACGVRYKSGRLVPEYRPASSPTFVLTKHSNSHRKVLELRKKNEMMVGSHQQQNQRWLEEYSMSFDGSKDADFLIHQPDFGEIIC